MTTARTAASPLNILIVEDSLANIRAAKQMLAEHNLTIVSGFDDALTALKRNRYSRQEVEAPEKFDAVLTDCMYPKGGTACMGPDARVDCKAEAPYGPMIVLHAIEAGVRHIGLITQGNHHKDPFVFALDTLCGFKSEKVNVAITNEGNCLVYTESGDRVDPQSEDCKNWWKAAEEDRVMWVKDWKRLLDRTMGVSPSVKGERGEKTYPQANI